MPITLEEKVDKSEQMWSALTRHIIRERERKKQEREAEVEEERLRKEREAREQQDVMTLGETREQISQLEMKLTHLKEEKHQLFLQLKKVLNEDDNRRRQLVKESNDNMIPLQELPAGISSSQSIYIPPSVTRTTPILQQSFKTAIKRPRSPSPLGVVSLYHQNYAYKQATIPTTYQGLPPKDDRRQDMRAVLWNKTSQYAQPNSFNPASAQDIQLYGCPQGRETTPSSVRLLYEPLARPSGQLSSRPPRSNFQLEHKPLDHYVPLRASNASHIIHSVQPVHVQSPHKSAVSNAGGDYPIRSANTQQQQQYQQQVLTPAVSGAIYSSQARATYQQSPSGPLSYPLRD